MSSAASSWPSSPASSAGSSGSGSGVGGLLARFQTAFSLEFSGGSSLKN